MHSQSNTAEGVGDELLSDAKGIGSSAVNRLHGEVDARKGDAATQVKSVSSAVHQVAGGLDATAPAWLKSAFEQGAEQIQKFAEVLEQKDSRELVSQVSDFARGSPGTFLGVCAAAGFGAARIFKAGSSGNTPVQPDPIGDVYPDSASSQPSPTDYQGMPASSPSGEIA